MSYLIWSNEHKGWWGPLSCGYVQRIENAGIYSYEEALDICIDAMPGRFGREPFNEIPVPYEMIVAMLQSFKNTFPNHDSEPKEF